MVIRYRLLSAVLYLKSAQYSIKGCKVFLIFLSSSLEEVLHYRSMCLIILAFLIENRSLTLEENAIA